MLASQLRRMAQRVRHAPGLRSLDGVWNSVRPWYGRVLEKLSGDGGFKVEISGCPIRLSTRFAATAWESIEVANYDAFTHAVRPGAVVYDIGAHIGTYSILAIRRSAPNGRVVAYEPVDQTREFLDRHLAWNGACDRAIVRSVGCSSKNGEASLFFREGEMNGDSSLLPMVGSQSKLILLRTLDSEVAELGLVPTIIKIDVEGWEFEVLKGAERTLRRDRPSLFLSLHPRALQELQTSPEEVLRWLRERGYNCRTIAADHEIHVLATALNKEELVTRTGSN